MPPSFDFENELREKKETNIYLIQVIAALGFLIFAMAVVIMNLVEGCQ